jgi:hypothetical protein
LFASLIVLLACAATPPLSPQPAVASAPQFNAAGELLRPTDYRSWMFLTSGFAMAYGPGADEAGVPVFDNVFVGRGPYAQFLQTGWWPESTMFVIEIRSSEHAGSIVTTGHYQADGVELVAEVKDSSRFVGAWGFFSFDTTPAGATSPAKLLPRDEPCYACHAEHAAVENTFTQFYPTLLPVARARGTVRKDFEGIPPSASEIYDEIVAHGWESAKQTIDIAAAKWPTTYLAHEPTLTRIGIRLRKAGRTGDSIELLGEVTQRFPGSSNAWDSLAEGLEDADRRDEAQKANARGLAALAGDGSLAGSRRGKIERSLKDRSARLAK